jgi:hypothetical protein
MFILPRVAGAVVISSIANLFWFIAGKALVAEL